VSGSVAVRGVYTFGLEVYKRDLGVLDPLRKIELALGAVAKGVVAIAR